MQTYPELKGVRGQPSFSNILYVVLGHHSNIYTLSGVIEFHIHIEYEGNLHLIML